MEEEEGGEEWIGGKRKRKMRREKKKEKEEEKEETSHHDTTTQANRTEPYTLGPPHLYISTVGTRREGKDLTHTPRHTSLSSFASWGS